MVDEKYKKIGGEIGFSYFLLFAQLLSSPFAIVLLTRILGKELFGVYSLFSVFVGLLSVVLQLGLAQYMIAKLPSLDRKKWPKIFYSIIFFEIIFLAIVLSAFYISPLRPIFLGANKLSAYSDIIAISLVIIFFATIGSLYDYYYRAKQSLNVANTMELLRLKGWVIPLLVLYALFRKFSLTQVFLVWAGFTIFAFLIYLFISKKEVVYLFKQKVVQYDLIAPSLKFGMPLIPGAVLSWIIVASGRYILNYFSSSSIVGLYSLAYSVLGLLFTLGITASSVILPYFSEAKWTDRKKYNTYFSASIKYGLILVIPGLVGTLILRKEIITLLSGPAYIAASPVIITLLLYPLFAFLASMGSNCLMINGKILQGGGIYLIGAALNVGFNIILIPTYGMHGAAISTVTSYFAMALLTLYYSKSYVKLDYGFLKIPQILLSAVLMGVVLYFVHPATALQKIIAIAGGGGIYFVLIVLTKALEKSELELVKSSVLGVLKIGMKSESP